MQKKHQQGAALITALMVVALIVTASSAMIMRQRLSVHRTQLMMSADQAYLYAQGVEQWAKGVLRQNFEDTTGSDWPKELPLTEVEGGSIKGTIYDAQALFNLNSLINEETRGRFDKLIRTIDSEAEDSYAIEDATAWWVQDNVTEEYFLEDYDSYYSELAVPYRASHLRMTSLSELRLVKGMTADLFSNLQPYITALPSPGSPININTASEPVLMTLSEFMTSSAARSIIAKRKEKPFTSTAELIQTPEFAALGIESSQITVISDYFLVRADVYMGKQHIIVYQMLRRGKYHDSATVTLIWQTRGTL